MTNVVPAGTSPGEAELLAYTGPWSDVDGDVDGNGELLPLVVDVRSAQPSIVTANVHIRTKLRTFLMIDLP
jgi:hypothetical protein